MGMVPAGACRFAALQPDRVATAIVPAAAAAPVFINSRRFMINLRQD
jgi:hypothetical protein